jgi:mannosyl-3-phosphoglycerate synthase
MNIDTVRFSHILETNDLADLDYFLSHTAFIVSHKSESVETLLGVLWYLPVNSPIIVVTNCPQDEIEHIKIGLTEHLPHHKKVYLVHQKDEGIADLFNRCGVNSILGRDGNVVDGKGEGMYIGTLCAFLLGYPEWVVFYDADNFVPSALLEYTLALSRLFMCRGVINRARTDQESDTLVMGRRLADWTAPDLHNVRICWASKPALGSSPPIYRGGNLQEKLLGRCTRVVSPIFSTLLDECFGIRDYTIVSSNAGEQAMTMKTAKTLRFSSKFSVETFQMLDFLFHAQSANAILQQYQAHSPHFHDKKDDEHIKKMIAESLGTFFFFDKWLPRKVKRQLRQVYAELGLEFVSPVVYPALQDLPLVSDETFVSRYMVSTFGAGLINGLEVCQQEETRETDRLPKIVVEYAEV